MSKTQISWGLSNRGYFLRIIYFIRILYDSYKTDLHECRDLIKTFYKRNREMTLHWKKAIEEGKNITIYDFDGPRTEEGGVMCIEVNEELVRERISDIKYPFGHGYVVACAIGHLNVFCN